MLFVKIARRVLAEHADFLKFSQEFMGIGVRKPNIRKVMTSNYKEQVEKVSRTIEQGVTSGKFIKVDPFTMARAIVLITMGAFNVYFSLDADFNLADQHSFDIEQIISKWWTSPRNVFTCTIATFTCSMKKVRILC